MLKWTTLALLVWGQLALGMTDHSKMVNSVQEKYADQFKKYPILIFDIDEISLRYGKANAFGEDKEQELKRAKVIQSYVEDKTGVKLSDSDSLSLEPYTTVMKEGAYAVPLKKKFPGKDVLICAVFPASPNSNQRLETERIIGYDIPGAYDDVHYLELKNKLTYQELKLFSIYHELSHCLDPKFLPAVQVAWEPDAHGIHLSESYAESLALILMEREGYKDLGLSRAMYRNLYTKKAGPWFAANPGYGMGNPAFKSGGAIYYLVPSLMATKGLIKNKEIDPSANLEDLIEETVRIVDENAMSGRTITAVVNSFDYGKEKSLETYRNYVLKYPNLFDGTYRDLLYFFDFSDYLLGKVLGGEFVEETPLPLKSLGHYRLCEAYQAEDLNTLWMLIDDERSELFGENGSIEEQKMRQKKLNDIFNSLSNCQ